MRVVDVKAELLDDIDHAVSPRDRRTARAIMLLVSTRPASVTIPSRTATLTRPGSVPR